MYYERGLRWILFRPCVRKKNYTIVNLPVIISKWEWPITGALTLPYILSRSTVVLKLVSYNKILYNLLVRLPPYHFASCDTASATGRCQMSLSLSNMWQLTHVKIKLISLHRTMFLWVLIFDSCVTFDSSVKCQAARWHCTLCDAPVAMTVACLVLASVVVYLSISNILLVLAKSKKINLV